MSTIARPFAVLGALIAFTAAATAPVSAATTPAGVARAEAAIPRPPTLGLSHFGAVRAEALIPRPIVASAGSGLPWWIVALAFAAVAGVAAVALVLRTNRTGRAVPGHRVEPESASRWSTSGLASRRSDDGADELAARG
jgi:hypothetical protein